MKKLIIKKPPKKKLLSPKVAFYSFLVMALVAIWIGAYSNNKNTEPQKEKPVSAKEHPVSSDEYVTSEKADDKITASTDDEAIIKEIEETFENTTEDSRISLKSPDGDEKQAVTYITLPVSGLIIKPFSDTELIYSKTMSDYRTHPGIDIKTDIGTDVLSPQNGKIAEISKDDKLGYTITIDHGNMISKISNLSSKIDIKVGDKVNLGQKIAICGDSAEYEIADESHIHYELKVNGVNVNPLEYLE